MSSLSTAISQLDALILRLQDGSILQNAPPKQTGTDRNQLTIDTDGQNIPREKQGKKKKKEKKDKPQQPKKKGNEVQDVIQKAYLVVARVENVKAHPNSDKLIICQLDCGDHSRQIVAGLQQYVDVGTFEGTKVVCIINLKTAKLGGETSEGMILASSSDSKVYPIIPPSSATPGTLVYPEKLVHAPADASLCPKTLKGDMWRSIVPEFSVSSEVCCYKGHQLVAGEHGPVTAPGFTMPHVTIN